jgi:hypothetical protein
MRYSSELLLALIFHLLLVLFFAFSFTLDSDKGTLEPEGAIQAFIFDDLDIKQEQTSNLIVEPNNR